MFQLSLEGKVPADITLTESRQALAEYMRLYELMDADVGTGRLDRLLGVCLRLLSPQSGSRAKETTLVALGRVARYVILSMSGTEISSTAT